MCVYNFRQKHTITRSGSVEQVSLSQSHLIPPICVCIHVCVYIELCADITAQSAPSCSSFYTPCIGVGLSSQLENNDCHYVCMCNERTRNPSPSYFLPPTSDQGCSYLCAHFDIFVDSACFTTFFASSAGHNGVPSCHSIGVCSG